jgi:hypothetical protein
VRSEAEIAGLVLIVAGVSAQSIIQATAAALSQPRIELSEADCAWDRHHEVASRVAHQPFDLTLIITLARPPEPIGE